MLISSSTGLEDDAPWEDLDGKGIKARRLAILLKPYGVRPKKIRISDDSTTRGYKREDLEDPWQRYLPSAEVEQTEQAERMGPNGTNVPDVPHVPGPQKYGEAKSQEVII